MNPLKFITKIALVCFILSSATIEAQKFKGLDKSPMDAVWYPISNREPNKSIRVIYSRPQLKDRLLSALAPEGKVWRTGANEATNITFYKDMKIAGKAIKAGEYSLFTIPGEKEWTIILSKDVNVWGAYSYNEANDALRIMVPVSSGEPLEAFSMAFSEDGTLNLGWDTVRVAIPITE